jgi:hypothetical protein
MSDIFSRISNVNATYPVKPVQPAQKDGDSDKRKKEQPKPAGDDAVEGGADDNVDNDKQKAIDEYV